MNIRWLYYQVHGRMPARRSPKRPSGRGPARSPRYRAWIRTLECAACGSITAIEAAHTGSDGGQAQKASDYSCIPLCFDCHRARPDAYHRDRAACERRIELRLRLSIRGLVVELNATWFRGRSEAA